MALVTVYPVAAQSTSGSYRVDQYFFGNGGELDASSANYRARQTSGETAVGNSSSTNYQIQAGFNTDRDSSLELTINTTNVNLGTITTSAVATGNASFSVKTYRASGYVVTSSSPGLSNGGHIMSAPASPTAPGAAGSVERFGMNLAANTSPTTFGAAPVQVPDSTFSFGTANSNYNTANQYMYVNGDTLASSTKSSGQTDYTISYILNITNVTPGGTYTMNQAIVATSTF